MKNLHNDPERTISNAEFLNSLEFCSGMGRRGNKDPRSPSSVPAPLPAPGSLWGNFSCKPVGTPACGPTSVHTPREQPC